MRICQIVTYISNDGAFGGPVAVAVAQAAELAREGHEVHLWAAWDGRAAVEAPEVRLHLFRVKRNGRPLTTFFSVRMTLVLAARSFLRPFDVVHLHFGRDLVSLSSWLATRPRSRRTVLQPHGMVMPDERLKSRLVDRFIVKRALRQADRVLNLSSKERAGLRDVAGDGVRQRVVNNGLQVREVVDFVRPSREVVFLARLHPRKHVLRFAEAAEILISQGTDLVFRIIGPDEGDLAPLDSFIRKAEIGDHVRYDGAVDATEARRRLAQALVYVLPSRGEVFPMTVVEALASGTPSVITSDCGLAEGLGRAAAALVVEPEPELLAGAIRALADDEEVRVELARRGHRYAREHFAIGAVVGELIRDYRG